MQFVELTPEEFDAFSRVHFSHYTQSTTHYHYRNAHYHDAHLVGVKTDDGTVLAACLLTEARALKVFKYFYTHRGPIMDHTNYPLVQFFYKSLASYLKARRGLYILADPYVLENIRNAEGEITTHYHNDMLIKTMAQAGFVHQGYPIGYDQMSQIRWLSVLDLKDKDEATLLKNMDYQTRRNIKKTEEMGVKVRELSIEETPTFFKLFKMAEEKHGFKFRDEPYFRRMLETYGEQASLQLAYIDLSHYMTHLQKSQATLLDQLTRVDKQLETSNAKKLKTQLQQLKQQYDSIQKRINQTQEMIDTDGPILNLAAALYICTPYEVYYLSSGSNPKYNAYMGAYKLQWDMIKHAKAHNIPRYNFYGITGDFSKDAIDYGVQQFKRGFDAHVEEYIGDFIKPLRPTVYKLAQKFKLI